MALQTAIELEHSTIPVYLTALYSIKPNANREVAALIRSVVIEEMLHMALACNILISIGGSPSIGQPGFIAAAHDLHGTLLGLHGTIECADAVFGGVELRQRIFNIAQGTGGATLQLGLCGINAGHLGGNARLALATIKERLRQAGQQRGRRAAAAQAADGQRRPRQ